MKVSNDARFFISGRTISLILGQWTNELHRALHTLCETRTMNLENGIHRKLLYSGTDLVKKTRKSKSESHKTHQNNRAKCASCYLFFHLIWGEIDHNLCVCACIKSVFALLF